jgi:beta-glucosidase
MYMKAFFAVIKAGTASIMPGHNEVTMNGLPCHANKYLLTDILRNEYNYTGLVSSDYNDIASMVGYHFVAN